MRDMTEEMTCVLLNTTHAQLSCLNDIKARLYLPVTVFLGLLIVVGTLGNIAVCLVYGRRKIRVSSHYFILSLAVLDLITCVIGMPTEMADLILPLTFNSPLACKVLRFLHSSTIIASSTILIEVAFDRYFRICRMGRQFTANKARLLCMGALVLGVIFSWPSCVLFGKKTVDINISGHVVHGTDCSTDDSMRGTIYPTIYYLFLFSLFGITLTFFTVLYAKIGLRIVGQNKVRAGGVVRTGMSPQERLAHVLKSGINKDVETPSSDVSSDPSSSQGHSSSSGSSGASCRSSRPLVEAPTSTLANTNGQAKSCVSDRLQSPCFVQEGTRVKVMEHIPEQFEPRLRNERLSGLNKTNPNLNENTGHGAGANNNKRRTVSYSRCVNTRSSNNDRYDTPSKSDHTTRVQKICSKFNKRSLSCCCNPQQLEEKLDYHRYRLRDNNNIPHHEHLKEPEHIVHQRMCNSQLRVGKTTTVLFAVTLAYILSFLPYLTVMVMRSVVKGLEDSLSPMGELAYKLCVKSFFINNAINPIIYSFLNQAFRQDATRMLRRICRQKRREPTFRSVSL